MFKPCTKLADELRELNCRSLALRFVCCSFFSVRTISGLSGAVSPSCALSCDPSQRSLGREK